MLRVHCIFFAFVTVTIGFAPKAIGVNAQTWEGDKPATSSGQNPLVCGDVDGDGYIGFDDINSIVGFLFFPFGGQEPPEGADMDGCTGVDFADLDVFFNHLFCTLEPLNCNTVECSLVPGGSITLDHVDGLDEAGVLRAGIPETHFYLRLTNDATSNIFVTNGFQVYSPDGAEWSSLTAKILDPGWESTFNAARTCSADGQGADTAGFRAFQFSCMGQLLVPDFDQVVYKITLGRISPVHDGKTIVLDSAYFPPNGTWKWGRKEAPTWDGPHYFTIVCCVGLRGNVDSDPEDICDLGDLTKLIDYLFISLQEPECMDEANIDGSMDSIVDLADLTALIDYLFITFTPPAECL